MSILTPITRIALLGGVASIAYAGIMAALPGSNNQVTEPGFANPANVELYKPKNESGRVELYLRYENGIESVILPIMSGPNGPVVGDADYNWGSMLPEKQESIVVDGWKGLAQDMKSELVKSSWAELLPESRKLILKGELEKMIEKYGE